MVPTTKDKVLSFLQVTRFLHYWFSSFSLLACPLYEVALGPSHELILEPIVKPFHKLQSALAAQITNQYSELIALTCAFQLAEGVSHS